MSQLTNTASHPVPEWLHRLYGAGQEHLWAEAGAAPRGCPHKDEEVAVDAQQPLDGLRHVEVGEPRADLQLEEVAPQVAAQEALHLLHVLALLNTSALT